MGFDQKLAADVLRGCCAESALHTVILGAGSNTRLVLHELGAAPPGTIRAILDDNPNLSGQRISDLPVCLPEDYPLREVGRVVITSEAFEAEMTRRAHELFGPGITIVYTFDTAGSLSSQLSRVCNLVESRWVVGEGTEPLWYAADRLYSLLHTRLTSLSIWRYSATRQVQEFARLRETIDSFVCWQGANLLNFGCGGFHPLGLSLLAKLVGARLATATDLLPLADEPRAARALAEMVAELVMYPPTVLGPQVPSREAIIGQLALMLDFDRLREGCLIGAVHSREVEYKVESIYESSLSTDTYDIVISRAVFEHLPDVPGALSVLHRLLHEDGVVYLTIDMSDHRWHQNPTMYKHWSHLENCDEPTYVGTNRLRFPDYPPMFERAGFRIEQYTPIQSFPLSPGAKARLAPRYRRMSDADLAVTGAVGILRKAK